MARPPSQHAARHRDPRRNRHVGDREPDRLQRLGRRAGGRWHGSLDSRERDSRQRCARHQPGHERGDTPTTPATPTPVPTTCRTSRCSAPVAGGVQGTLNSSANATFTIQFFGNAACDASGNGEGETLARRSVGDDRRQRQRDDSVLRGAGRSGRHRDGDVGSGDTSEFSACVTVPLGPATFTVTNTNDSGAGSLRQAILDANARANTADTIAFNIAGAAPFTIAACSGAAGDQ